MNEAQTKQKYQDALAYYNELSKDYTIGTTPEGVPYMYEGKDGGRTILPGNVDGIDVEKFLMGHAQSLNPIPDETTKEVMSDIVDPDKMQGKTMGSID